MEILAAGRDADVYAFGDGRVLRRYRDGRSAAPEAEAITVARRAGYPTPRLHAVDGADMVLDLVPGPTLLEALICLQTGLAPEAAGITAGAADVVRASVEGLVAGFTATLDHEFHALVDSAATLRRRDPNLTADEIDLVAAACAAVRRLAQA